MPPQLHSNIGLEKKRGKKTNKKKALKISEPFTSILSAQI